MEIASVSIMRNRALHRKLFILKICRRESAEKSVHLKVIEVPVHVQCALICINKPWYTQDLTALATLTVLCNSGGSTFRLKHPKRTKWYYNFNNIKKNYTRFSNQKSFQFSIPALR